MKIYQIVREEWGYDCWGKSEFCGYSNVGGPWMTYGQAKSHIPNDGEKYKIQEIEVNE